MPKFDSDKLELFVQQIRQKFDIEEEELANILDGITLRLKNYKDIEINLVMYFYFKTILS